MAEDAHKPHLYDLDGTPVNPLCFLSNIGTEDAPIYPTTFCEGEDISSSGESVLDEGRFVSTDYQSHYYDHETDETFTSQGFVGYRVIGQVDHKNNSYLAVVTLENGGGSGTFSSIMLLEPTINPDNDTRAFRQVEVLTYGDRCMNGYADAWVEDGELIYRVHSTMIDMLGFSGDPERAILKADAASSLPFCAACCYAQAEFSSEGFRGMFFPKERMKPAKDDSEAATCIEELVDLNITQAKQDYFNEEDYGFFVREIEHTCLGAVEGE